MKKLLVMCVVKRLNLVLDEEVFEKLKAVKERHKLTWEQLLVKGAECLERAHQQRSL